MSPRPLIRQSSILVALIAALSFAVRTTLGAQSAGGPDSSTARFSIGSTQTMLGVVRFSFADLDSRFAAAGLPKVAGSAAAVGLGADLRVGRKLFGAGFQSLLSSDRTDAAYRTRLSGSYSLFDAGFAVVNTRRLSIYPLVGVGATHVSVNVKERGDFSFDDGLHTPGRDLGVSGTAGLVHAGVLVEQRFQRKSGAEFALSMRIGMTRSVGSQAWQSDEARVNEGPSGVRGSYMRIALSRPLSNRRDAVVPIAATVLQTVIR